MPKKKDPLAVALGNRIRQLRQNAGISQEDLALRSELHRTYIGGVERAERNPTVLTVGKLANALGVPLKSIFSGLDERGKAEQWEYGSDVIREDPSAYHPKKPSHRFIDLFCGIGGFRLGCVRKLLFRWIWGGLVLLGQIRSANL
ncbi:MAG: helix-turn-helix domain-containing protein [Verrucomicrobiales bacterium]